MVHAGLDLSRRKVDVCLIDGDGEVIGEFASPCDRDGLRGLVQRVGLGVPVRGVLESMSGARFVHDSLEQLGWDVLIADAQKVKGLAPLACKTDRIDARVLAVLSHRDLVPAIWLPDPRVRRERELARFRMHLVKHRSMLKNRIHSALINWGKPCPVSDLFGVAGRQLLDELEVPQPWRSSIDASLLLIDDLERQIANTAAELKATGADHPYVPLLMSAPGIGWGWPSPSPPRSARSNASTRLRSSSATPACARASTSPAARIAAGSSPKPARNICAGRCSKRPCTRCATAPIATVTSTPRSASAASAAPRSPRSTSPAG
jgi:hypothetical protein